MEMIFLLLVILMEVISRLLYLEFVCDFNIAN